MKKLSKREKQVLRCIKLGFKNKLIAKTLKINEKTVSTYVKRIYSKLDLYTGNNVYILIDQAIKLKLL